MIVSARPAVAISDDNPHATIAALKAMTIYSPSIPDNWLIKHSWINKSVGNLIDLSLNIIIINPGTVCEWTFYNLEINFFCRPNH